MQRPSFRRTVSEAQQLLTVVLPLALVFLPIGAFFTTLVLRATIDSFQGHFEGTKWIGLTISVVMYPLLVGAVAINVNRSMSHALSLNPVLDACEDLPQLNVDDWIVYDSSKQEIVVINGEDGVWLKADNTWVERGRYPFSLAGVVGKEARALALFVHLRDIARSQNFTLVMNLFTGINEVEGYEHVAFETRSFANKPALERESSC